MSRLLIVEDEYLERMELREQLSVLIPSENIRTAGSVNSAIDAIKAEPPDLVLLDIMLMGSSGFEVASFIKKEYPVIKVVILTAYNEFDFAHMAMSLGISDYILKPVKPSVLLDKIKDLLADNQSIQSTTLIWPLLENDSVESIKHKLARYPNVIGAIHLPPDAKNRLNAIHIKQSLDNCGWTETKGNWIFLFLWLSQETDLVDFFLPRLDAWTKTAGCPVKIGISSCFGNVNQLQESYHNAITARRCAVLFPSDSVLMAEKCLNLREPAGSYPFELETALLMAINNGNLQRCQRCVHDITESLLNSSGKDITTLSRWLQNLSYGITRFSEQKQINYSVRFDLASVNDRKELIEQVHQAAATVAKLLKQKRESGNPLILKALEIIRSRYNEDINLTDVAQELFINHIYLSRLFKHEVGHSFRAYLIHVRMEAAARLLTSSDKTIGQIASEVGYNDANYFSRSFNDYYGISPKDYGK